MNQEKFIEESKHKQKALFYEYRQNNSGGSFVIDEKVTENVIIQAHSAKEADSIAETKGIYFNGCETGQDCYCCGDRWSLAGAGSNSPSLYGKPIDETCAFLLQRGACYCRIYYLDGTKTRVF